LLTGSGEVLVYYIQWWRHEVHEWSEQKSFRPPPCFMVILWYAQCESKLELSTCALWHHYSRSHLGKAGQRLQTLALWFYLRQWICITVCRCQHGHQPQHLYRSVGHSNLCPLQNWSSTN